MCMFDTPHLNTGPLQNGNLFGTANSLPFTDRYYYCISKLYRYLQVFVTQKCHCTCPHTVNQRFWRKRRVCSKEGRKEGMHGAPAKQAKKEIKRWGRKGKTNQPAIWCAGNLMRRESYPTHVEVVLRHFHRCRYRSIPLCFFCWRGSDRTMCWLSGNTVDTRIYVVRVAGV
jgi:hypothetical protein